ncbi:hypothetical protein YSY43_48750 [Paenibacillus sp. YSY-4.3]
MECHRFPGNEKDEGAGERALVEGMETNAWIEQSKPILCGKPLDAVNADDGFSAG